MRYRTWTKATADSLGHLKAKSSYMFKAALMLAQFYQTKLNYSKLVFISYTKRSINKTLGKWKAVTFTRMELPVRTKEVNNSSKPFWKTKAPAIVLSNHAGITRTQRRGPVGRLIKSPKECCSYKWKSLEYPCCCKILIHLSRLWVISSWSLHIHPTSARLEARWVNDCLFLWKSWFETLKNEPDLRPVRSSSSFHVGD